MKKLIVVLMLLASNCQAASIILGFGECHYMTQLTPKEWSEQRGCKYFGDKGPDKAGIIQCVDGIFLLAPSMNRCQQYRQWLIAEAQQEQNNATDREMGIQ